MLPYLISASAAAFSLNFLSSSAANSSLMRCTYVRMYVRAYVQ